jgi:NADPH:quinone reductase-like Zn-dependent oxidoreductase
VIPASARIMAERVRGHRYAFVSTRVDHRRLTQLAQLVDKRVLDLRVAQTYGLEQLAEAHRASEGGHARGKLVIRHDDPHA